jgi:hypothetical protein
VPGERAPKVDGVLLDALSLQEGDGEGVPDEAANVLEGARLREVAVLRASGVRIAASAA